MTIAPELGHNALEDFLAGVEQRAYRMAHYALWDHDQALDVVQDSMLKLVEKYADRSPAEWPALFFTIVNHRINDARRWRRVRQGAQRFLALFQRQQDASDDSPGESEAAESEQVAAGPSPEQALSARRQRAAIDAAVAKLPEKQRQVFLMREWQELSIKETAEILGCTEGTVKQHHYRALQALRHTLAEVWSHDEIQSQR